MTENIKRDEARVILGTSLVVPLNMPNTDEHNYRSSDEWSDLRSLSSFDHNDCSDDFCRVEKNGHVNCRVDEASRQSERRSLHAPRSRCVLFRIALYIARPFPSSLVVPISPP